MEKTLQFFHLIVNQSYDFFDLKYIAEIIDYIDDPMAMSDINVKTLSKLIFFKFIAIFDVDEIEFKTAII